MTRYGKKLKRKKKVKGLPSEERQDLMRPKDATAIFNPDAYKEHMKSDAKLRGQKEGISKEHMEQMGFSSVDIKMMEDMRAIKSSSPFMAIARCTNSFKFSKGAGSPQQTCHEGKVYVMALGVYDHLRYSPGTRKTCLKPYKIPFKDVFNRYEGQDLTDKTILIWRTGGIGDLLFIKPNIQYIKERWPTAKVWLACDPSYQAMTQHWEDVDKHLNLPIDYYEYFSKADYHVTFEGAIERNKEAHTKNAYNMFSEWMGLNLSDDKLIPHQNPPAKLVPACERILLGWGVNPHEKDFVLLQIQPSSPIRAINIEKWIEVINELTARGHKVVLTDSPPKADYVQTILNQCKNQEMLFNFAKHSESLDYTIALASLAKATMGPDSSLCHISGSLGVPTVGIFGPFLGDIRLRHFPKADWYDCQRYCAPCFLHGNDLCEQAKDADLNHSPCLDNFEAAVIVDKMEKLI